MGNSSESDEEVKTTGSFSAAASRKKSIAVSKRTSSARKTRQSGILTPFEVDARFRAIERQHAAQIAEVEDALEKYEIEYAALHDRMTAMRSMYCFAKLASFHEDLVRTCLYVWAGPRLLSGIPDDRPSPKELRRIQIALKASVGERSYRFHEKKNVARRVVMLFRYWRNEMLSKKAKIHDAQMTRRLGMLQKLWDSRHMLRFITKTFRAWSMLSKFLNQSRIEVETLANVRARAKVEAQHAEMEQDRRLFDVLAFVKANRRATGSFPLSRSP